LYNEGAPAAITYVVTAETAAGCYGTDTINVKIFKTPASIFMPSGFTPNHDGRNDVIRPILAGVKQLIFFRVYNRWGQLVFTSFTTSTGWDGRYKGAVQAQDVYGYTLNIEFTDGTKSSKKGDITLLR